jgi:predicted DNA-binding transcriptional regulator AlpA
MTDRLPNWPRLMGAYLASSYVGLSETTFLAGVKRGDWPESVTYGRRKLWDQRELDAAIDRMSGRVAAQEAGAEWMEEVNGSA